MLPPDLHRILGACGHPSPGESLRGQSLPSTRAHRHTRTRAHAHTRTPPPPLGPAPRYLDIQRAFSPPHPSVTHANARPCAPSITVAHILDTVHSPLPPAWAGNPTHKKSIYCNTRKVLLFKWSKKERSVSDKRHAPPPTTRAHPRPAQPQLYSRRDSPRHRHTPCPTLVNSTPPVHNPSAP